MKKSIPVAMAMMLWLAGSVATQSMLPPTVQFSVSDYYTSEDLGSATITVTLIGNTGGNTVTVDYATANGTATAGLDYVANSGTLTFAPGETSKTFTVTVKSDLIAEPGETVLLSLSNPVNAALGPPSAATLTIWDTPPPTVQFDWTDNYTTENYGTATITATVLGDTRGNTVTVDYATTDGSATSPGDYASTSGTLTFQPGTTVQTFTVTVNRDLLPESDETVLLSLSNPTNAVLGVDSAATLTIWDSPPPTVQFEVTDFYVSEDGGTATINVTLIGDAGGNTITVDYATADGSATAPSDYIPASGTVTFLPGDTALTFSIAINRDLLSESDETVLLSLSNPTNAILGSPTSAVLTIWDAPAPTVQFELSDYTTSEASGIVTITAILTGDTAGQTVTVDYATADGSAAAGSDYASAAGTLTFAPGDIAHTFTITVYSDMDVESDETVLLTLSNATNAALGANSAATVTITDSPPVSVQFESGGYVVSETEAQARINVTLSEAASSSVSVSYATADGTGPNAACAGTDYVATSGALTFAAGETTKTITVTLLNPAVNGPSKTASVTLTSPTGAVLGSPSTTTLTIMDDYIGPPPNPIPVTVVATGGTFYPDPSDVGDPVSVTLSAQALRPSSPSLSAPTWNWQYCGVQYSDNQSGPWTSATSTGYGIVPGSPTSDSLYDYSSITVTTSFPNAAYWKITFKAQVTYTDGNGLCYAGDDKAEGKGVAEGVEKVIVKGSTPENAGPAYVVVGKSITLLAKPKPAGTDFPGGKPTWTVKAPKDSAVGKPGAGAEATITPDKKGEYVVKASVGGSSASFTIKAVEVKLKSVSFSGAKCWQLCNDANDFDYKPPHWLVTRAAAAQYPVAYTRNTSMKLEAEFTVDPSPKGAKVKIKATGPGALKLQETDGTADDGKVTLDETELKNGANAIKLPDTVKYYNTMDFAWEVAFDNGAPLTYGSAGTSKNKVYVTYADPKTRYGNRHTLFNIGCAGADGKNTEADVVAGVWKPFSDRMVKRVDGKQITYWIKDPTNTSMGDMLEAAKPDGNCAAWANLLVETLAAQGITADRYIVEPDTNVNNGANGFMIKNWAFGEHIRSGINGKQDSVLGGDDVAVKSKGKDTPVILPGKNGKLESTLKVDDTQQDGIYKGKPYPYLIDADARSQDRIKAQGNDKSPRDFTNHYVVKYGSKIYDPSYGTGPFDKEIDHEKASIDGITASVMNEIVCKKKDPNKQELKYTLAR